MLPMGEHELILRHAASWADTKGRRIDRDVLETVLDLRGYHDDLAPQAWPSGSVDYLLLTRWPSHGPVEPPDTETLLATLDSFWRFLRATGRMAAGSADPKTLLREARRAAPRMAEACADPAGRGAAKSLIEFGRGIGLSLEDAGSVEEAEAILQQVTARFNELPDAERHRLMPGQTAYQGSVLGRSATRLMHQGMEPGWASAGEPDEGPEEMMPREDPAVVAPLVRGSAFVQQCLRLCAWVGERKEVTATGVLRLAEARAAYRALDLSGWEHARRQLSAHPRFDGPVPPPEELAKQSLDAMRSAGDCWPLHRLWSACEMAGRLTIGRTTVRAEVPADLDDAQWAQTGVTMVAAPLLLSPAWGNQEIQVGALLMLLEPGVSSVTEQRVCDWYWTRPSNYLSRFAEQIPDARADSDRWVRSALLELEDTGVWRRRGRTLHGTPLGHELGIVVAGLIESGLLGEGSSGHEGGD